MCTWIGRCHDGEGQQAVPLPIEFWDKERVFDVLGTRGYEGALFIFEQTVVIHIEEGERLTLVTKDERGVRASSLNQCVHFKTWIVATSRDACVRFFDYVGITSPLSDAKYPLWSGEADCHLMRYY